MMAQDFMSELPALLVFGVMVVALLMVDLRWVHRQARAIPFREAVFWSALWIILSLGFALGVHLWRGPEQALEFLTAYVLEKLLSLDNILVFAGIFTSMKVVEKYQHKVLFWGVLGAIVFRAVLIFLGLALIVHFAWIQYVFGAFLVVTGARMLRKRQISDSGEQGPLLRLAQKFFPVTPDYVGPSFLVKEDSRFVATPLFFVLLLVETTDVIFALDSVPAVFAVTQDPFIAFTSNILAVLGLRAMYFMVAGVVPRFRYLRSGLSWILVFVGIKMLGAQYFHVNILVALAVICGILATAIAASRKARARSSFEAADKRDR